MKGVNNKMNTYQEIYIVGEAGVEPAITIKTTLNSSPKTNY
jgi:hypothetical protein